MGADSETPWVDGKTFHQVVSATAEAHGANDAVVFPKLDLRWTYSEFLDRVEETAAALLALGVTKGDHVGIWSTNWPQWILAQFATATIGAVLVNVNPAYRRHEFAFILKQADISVLLITDRHKTSDYGAMVMETVPELRSHHFGDPLCVDAYPRLRHVVSIQDDGACPGIWTWPSFVQQAKRVERDAVATASRAVTCDDPVNIQYTSGTTGSPKGATLSHRNLLMNAYYVGDRQRMSSVDRLCIPVPFYHCFGCVMGTLMCAVYGATMVVPAESFEPEATLAAVEKEKCTALYGVPTMFNAEVHSPEFATTRLDTLRTGIMAGSPCPIELMKRVVAEMHLTEMTIAYGQTEASPVITQSRTTDSIEARVGTVGSVLPGLEVRLVDPDSREDVPDGTQGELCVRGHCVMIGYYNNPEATAQAVDTDGWLRTGDLATKTPDGNYKITGRIKDMIIRGGENIYPREIEEFLLTHPKIRDVQVFGVPDERYVEQVAAWIVLNEPGSLTADAVRAFCDGQIAHYKVPFYIEFAEEFPLTVTGKVQKFRLRDMAIERFGLEKAAKAQMA